MPGGRRTTHDGGIGVTVIDPQWVWPVNPSLPEVAGHYRVAVCVEDGLAEAGIGAHFVQAMARAYPKTRTGALGLPTEYIPHASRGQILACHGLTGSAISSRCRSLLNAVHQVENQTDRHSLNYRAEKVAR